MVEPSVDLNTAKSDIVFALLAASGKIQRRFDRVLSAVRGVSFSEYMLLKRLQQHDNGTASRAEFASAVNLSPAAVIRVLKPLEKTGFVSSLKHQHDARQTMIKLTNAGIELVHDADAVISDEITALSIPETESDALLVTLNALTNHQFK